MPSTVLHCFEKKTQRTAKSDVDLAKRRYRQAADMAQFGVTQPRISDLTRGKIDLFSIDTLVNMITAAGLHLDIRARAAS